ncbi:MAG: hypothetical protein M3X11_14105, partial [Acidobacteriota bacterium]|nr:hypothetical protein [Acidobacteriota bacterium]
MTRTQAGRLKLAVIILFFIAVAASGFAAYQYYSAKSAPLTTQQITALAKTTALEDRQDWLRLARGVLAAESVGKIAAPVEPRNNLGETSKVELGYQLFFDPIL